MPSRECKTCTPADRISAVKCQMVGGSLAREEQLYTGVNDSLGTNNREDS